jgi:hypothetical protein
MLLFMGRTIEKLPLCESWCEIESSPGHYALTQGQEQHVGSEAAALMYAVFRLGAAEAIFATKLDRVGPVFNYKQIKEFEEEF